MGTAKKTTDSSNNDVASKNKDTEAAMRRIEQGLAKVQLKDKKDDSNWGDEFNHWAAMRFPDAKGRSRSLSWILAGL